MKRFLVFLAMFLAASPVAAKEKGYLTAEPVDILKILPPAPVKGQARYDADRKIFRETRRFFGSFRWGMAVNDVNLSTPDMLRDFRCSTGLYLSPDTVPHLAHLMERVNADTSLVSGVAKDYYKRLRPYRLDHGAVCQPLSELGDSYDYPSGHTTRGWTLAKLLAELIPGRASAILARGRAFGESRIVCGAHNASAVEAGRMTAEAVLAAEPGSSEFQADFQTAKQELDALRHNAELPPPRDCADEDLVALPVF